MVCMSVMLADQSAIDMQKNMQTVFSGRTLSRTLARTFEKKTSTALLTELLAENWTEHSKSIQNIQQNIRQHSDEEIQMFDRNRTVEIPCIQCNII